jgi:hypothetical protein
MLARLKEALATVGVPPWVMMSTLVLLSVAVVAVVLIRVVPAEVVDLMTQTALISDAKRRTSYLSVYLLYQQHHASRRLTV